MASTMSKRCEAAGRGWVVALSLLTPTLLAGPQEPGGQDPSEASADSGVGVAEPEVTGSQLDPHYRSVADRDTIRSAWLARGGVERLAAGVDGARGHAAGVL